MFRSLLSGRRSLACTVQCAASATALIAAFAPDAWAQGSAGAEGSTAVLAPVVVTARHYDNAVGSSDAASQGRIRADLLKSRPLLRPGEVLEFVPGMIVTQHSGDGKANQYFLRGFNLDHGTDFATSVNGLPVNMPSHAHGQGYADLNSLLPELVSHIDYRKGPYFARNGDFAAAGSADIAYRTRLTEPLAQLTLGENGFQRWVGAGSGPLRDDMHLLGALEVQRNDGPWTVPEGLRKHNGVLSLSGGDASEGWQASAMAYHARWTSTDQIPERLLAAGQFQGRPFGRFDSLDASDGGNTRRLSLSGQWHRETDGARTQWSAYAIDYRLQLFSNFTYALARPDTGDQFLQQDDRRVWGAAGSHRVDHPLFGRDARSEVGLQWRQDRARVGLLDTVARRTVGTSRDDRVRQHQLGLYAQTSLAWTPWLRTVAGLRADAARFEVESLGSAANSGAASARQLSPKLSVILGPWAKTEVFLNAGRGFHSNDARGTTATVDPEAGTPIERVPGLVAAQGWELGARTEWWPGLQSSLALWQMHVDSELVYVGDAGTTEANRPSRRHGLEWSNRYIPVPWLLLDADLAWTRARFADADAAGPRIPQAVDRVGSVAVTLRELGPWSASLQWRYLGPGALVEDNSVRARSSLTTNLRISRRLDLGRNSELTLDVFNLANRKLNDIEYLYESQLPGELAPVVDRHIHPAEPRTVRVTLRLGL